MHQTTDASAPRAESRPTAADAVRTMARPHVQRARYRARRALDRIDNEPVRLARHLLEALHDTPIDVLYLGDSTSSFVAPYDTDRRRLPQMVADALGASVRVHVVKGASFNANMYEAYLRLLRATDQRPLVIASLAVRSHTPTLTRHPVHGHHRALATIRSIDASRGAWRVHGAWPPPTQADFDVFHQVPHATLLGQGTMGTYRERLAALEDAGNHEAYLCVLYDYLHGGCVPAGPEGLEAVTRLGSTLRSFGCCAVVYQLPVPVERGAELLGAGFRTRAEANLSALEEAYRHGAGHDALVVGHGTRFPTGEFLDPADGTEHLNAAGRAHLAGLIVDAVRGRLGGPVTRSHHERGTSELRG